MGAFAYKARDRLGRATAGTLEADSADDAVHKLRTKGLFPVEVRRNVALPGLEKKKGQFGVKIKPLEVCVFTRQLATMIRAGLPILACLDALVEQVTNKKFSQMLQAITRQVESGAGLSEALSQFPSTFDNLYINTIKTAETGGKLDETLEQLATLLEREQENRAKVKAALRYPFIVITVVVLAFGFLMTFVVPRFAEFFQKAQMELPLPTKILLGTYSFFKNYWYVAGLVLVAAIVGFNLFVRTPVGRRTWDAIQLRLPVFGKLFMQVEMSRFSRTLATLTRSGVPILTILDLVSGTVGNVIIAGAIQRIARSVNEGRGMAEPMKLSRLFPPMIVSMVAIGEETGRLDELLFHVADYYEQETDRAIKGLADAIEPIMLIFLGAIVLLMALGIFMPMWNMTQAVKA